MIGHRSGVEGTSSLGPRRYPTAPCLVLQAPWLSSDNPPSSRWGLLAGSTSNLSAGSGENNRGGCDKIQGGGSRTNSGIPASLSQCVVVRQCSAGEQFILMGRTLKEQACLPWLGSTRGGTKHLILSGAHEIELSLASKHRPPVTCYCPGRSAATVMDVRANSRPKTQASGMFVRHLFASTLSVFKAEPSSGTSSSPPS